DTYVVDPRVVSRRACDGVSGRRAGDEQGSIPKPRVRGRRAAADIGDKRDGRARGNSLGHWLSARVPGGGATLRQGIQGQTQETGEEEQPANARNARFHISEVIGCLESKAAPVLFDKVLL